MQRAASLFERIPVRWRIAATTAGLTLAILVVFALVLGNVVGERIRGDFEEELRGAASALAAETSVGVDPSSGQKVIFRSPRLSDSAMADGAVIRIVERSGHALATTDPGMNLGPPRQPLANAGDFRVASEPVPDSATLPAFVQYAEPHEGVDDSVGRLWLFLTAGVLGGTVLALLAGLTVADRAMRPIASLIAQARDIEATRDPSRRMPVPATDDEVGELARTMDGMLEALDEARGERERAFERQREFVADASHELRTPLTSVQANLELLQASLDEDRGEDRHAVDSALGSTRRMSRLVSDLLLLARADAGRRSARTEADLAEIARSALDEVAAISGGREIDVEVEAPLLIEGNPDELHRLVRNLLENAIRHTPAEAAVRLSARRDGDDALLEVADDGPGIPDELGDQVFQRFVRGEGGPADTKGGGGSGLGLAIVRAVADSHDGEVTAGSSDSGGARFAVKIPLIRFQTGGVVSDTDETPPAGKEHFSSRRAPR